jgi:lysophospholipase L1-like esterase
MPRQKLALRLTVTAAAVAVFPLLELGLRCGSFWYPPTDQPMSIWNPTEDRAMRFGGGMFMTAPRALWVPRPGARIVWGDGERVNEAGYRGPLRPPEHASDVLRIVVLGESAAFGYGVGYEETFCGRLEEILRQQGREVEVIDAAVVGYTIVQGLERYRAFAKAYDPDIVVEAFGEVNEHFMSWGPPDVQKVEMPLLEGGRWTEIVKMIRRNVRSVQLVAKISDQMNSARALERDLEFRKLRYEMELQEHIGEVDWKGQRRVPLDDFEKTLMTLRDEVRADDAILVVLSMPRRRETEAKSPVLATYTERIAEIARREGIAFADGWGAFRKAEESGAKEEDLFRDLWHPKAVGHRLLAEVLAGRIAEITAAR